MFNFISKHSNNPQSEGVKRARRGLLLCAAFTVAISCMPSAFADPATDPNLNKLEVKFFQHDFAKDADLNERLERLEKMVFGESRTGDADERLKNLLVAVPNLDAKPKSSGSGSSSSNQTASYDDDGDKSSAAPPPKSTARRPANPDDDAVAREQNIQGGSQYPAVTAIEKRLLGRDFSSETIVKRLERLEVKAFGKVSATSDLSDRVDQLKDRTGIDLAKAPPAGSDWADDDGPTGGGSVTYHPTPTPFSDNDGYQPRASGGSRGSYGGGGGAYGGGRSTASSGSSGSYGMGSPRRASDDDDQAGGSYGYSAPKKIASAAPPIGSGFPRTAPDFNRDPELAPTPAMGLSDTIGLLERELFGKNFKGETIPVRLNRLESTVFPNQKPASDMAMPDRVHRLTAAVPVSGPSGGRQIAQRSNPNPAPAPGYQQDDMGDLDPMPRTAPPRSGLSKIMNGLGSLIGGGGYGSAYPVGSNLVQDPQGSGLLWDRFTGNLIDPNTGAVIGNRMSSGSVNGMGMAPMPMAGAGYGSGFNNGLSPLGGAGYGMGGSNMRFGFGGSGIRFGGPSMMGGGSMGGMGVWP